MNSGSFIQGKCLTMCPKKEIIMRERERLVHILERSHDDVPIASGRKYKIKADPQKMVKSFRRSGPGRDMQCPEDLRPVYVLRKTVDYLMIIVLKRTDVQWPVVYGFITDRLRSIRQDLVIQQPSFESCVDILEPVVRFHAYAAYRLCEESIHVFDPKLNNSHFNECLIKILNMYESEDIETKPRWEMESLSLLHNIGDNRTLTRALSLPYTGEILFDMALAISLAHIRNDYYTIFQLFPKLPVLYKIVLGLQLPLVRRNALKAMNFAYSSKNLTYPLSNITSLLMFNNDEEACKECQYYGLQVDNGRVHFLKGTFDTSIKLANLKRMDSIDVELNGKNISRLLLENILVDS